MLLSHKYCRAYVFCAYIYEYDVQHDVMQGIVTVKFCVYLIFLLDIG